MEGAVVKEEEKKPDVGVYILLKVRDHATGRIIAFRLEKTTKLEKVMEAFCNTLSVKCNRFVFICDGRMVRSHQTPEELQIADGEEMEAIMKIPYVPSGSENSMNSNDHGGDPPQQGDYPFTGYPPAAECSGVNCQDLPTPPTGGSENDSESLKTEDKKSQICWNMTMDNILLDMLIEATRTVKKKGKKWDNKIWDSVSLSLSQSAKEEVQVKHIENRLRQMKTEFTNFLELKNKIGASYDPVKQMVLVSNDFWKEILTHPKEKKKFKAFQDRGLKWDFKKLSHVFGNSHATASYLQNRLNEMKTTNPGEKNMNMDVEESEENTSVPSTKVVYSKRQHGKRSRPNDEVKDMFKTIIFELQQLRQSKDPLAFARQLREAVMDVEGFSHRYLNTAFKLLMKRESEAKVFLVTDEEGKRDILNDLNSLIGDI